jgi:hypothetical protein
MMSALAGRAFSDLISTGLVERNLLISGVRGLGEIATGGGAFTDPGFLGLTAMQVAFSMPRIQGEILGLVGLPARHIKWAKQVANQIKDRLPPGTYTEGMTLIQTLERLDEKKKGTLAEGDPLGDLTSGLNITPGETGLLSRPRSMGGLFGP